LEILAVARFWRFIYLNVYQVSWLLHKEALHQSYLKRKVVLFGYQRDFGCIFLVYLCGTRSNKIHTHLISEKIIAYTAGCFNWSRIHCIDACIKITQRHTVKFWLFPMEHFLYRYFTWGSLAFFKFIRWRATILDIYLLINSRKSAIYLKVIIV
jgi:hypothetical protein